MTSGSSWARVLDMVHLQVYWPTVLSVIRTCINYSLRPCPRCKDLTILFSKGQSLPKSSTYPQPAVSPTAAPELTKTTLPPSSLLRRAGRVIFSTETKEKKLTSKCVFQESMVISGVSILPKGSRVPALRTSPSIRPYVLSARETPCERTVSSVLWWLHISGDGQESHVYPRTRRIEVSRENYPGGSLVLEFEISTKPQRWHWISGGGFLWRPIQFLCIKI